MVIQNGGKNIQATAYNGEPKVMTSQARKKLLQSLSSLSNSLKSSKSIPKIVPNIRDVWSNNLDNLGQKKRTASLKIIFKLNERY